MKFFPFKYKSNDVWIDIPPTLWEAETQVARSKDGCEVSFLRLVAKRNGIHYYDVYFSDGVMIPEVDERHLS